jgi:hypothetical protein
MPGRNGGPATEVEDGARDRRKFLTRGLTAGAAALGAWSLTSAPPARAAGALAMAGQPRGYPAGGTGTPRSASRRPPSQVTPTWR